MANDDRPNGHLGMIWRMATDKEFRKAELKAAREVAGVSDDEEDD